MKPLTAGLAVLVVVLAVLATATFDRPVLAGKIVPFNASFTTEFASRVAFPMVHVTVNREDPSSHMGRTETTTTSPKFRILPA